MTPISHVERSVSEPTRNLQTTSAEDALPLTEHHAVKITLFPPQPDASFPCVRGYELLAVVGTGGMGIVYEARHKELNRRVAIKTLRGEALADPEFRERFRAEAEAIAKLQHPNIIQVFEVGFVEPVGGEVHPSPFIALEFVDGGSLSQHTRTPQPAQFAAKMVETLARAAHAAHQLGIIHRDLKPANVLLTRDGQPKIADFGIAKQIDAECAKRAITRAGTVMGTPEYMAPEQLEGERVSRAVDVYSLGVILYELLTGRVPLQGATFGDTMMMALREEPVPPRRLQPGIPRDLETICLKCLEKSSAKRYESAEALADDLARFVEGRTIQARAVGATERTLRWAKRNPAVAMLSAAVLFVALTGLAGIVWQWNDARRNAADAQWNAMKAEDERNNAREAAKNERWERYRASVLAASSALRLHDINSARRSLADAPEEYRDWVWNLQHAQLDRSQYVLQGRGTQIDAAYFTPDGRWALLHGPDRSIRVWDLVEQKEFLIDDGSGNPRYGTLSDDGTLFAHATQEHTIIVGEVATGRRRAVLRGHTDEIDTLDFTPDGTRLITSAADRTARTWDIATGKQVNLFQAPLEVNRPLVISPDGRFAMARWNAWLMPCIWDMQTGREVVRLNGHDGPVMSLLFSPKGDRVVTVESFPLNTIRVWEAATGKLQVVLRGHENQVNHVEFSPDGNRLASCSMDRTVRLWDISPSPTPRESDPLFVLHGHTGWLHHVAFSPDGTRLISSSHDRTLRYWNAKTGRQLAVLQGHTHFVWRAGFRADGLVVASASSDGTMRLWDVRAVERDYAIRGHEKFVYSAAFNLDGERVASTAWDGTARVWHATSGKQLLLLDHGKGTIVSSVAYRPKGQMLATLARDNSVRLWDAETGQLIHRWVVPSKDWRDSRLAFHPSGDLLASGCADKRIRLWDVNTKAEVAVLEGHTDAIRDVSFSADGKWLASCSDFGERVIRIWDVATRKQAQALTGHTARIYSVAWNPTTTLLASGSDDGTVRLWDTSTWQEVGTLKSGVNTYGLAFSLDGKLLVAACSDNLIRVWDVATRQEVAELSGHNDYVHYVAFSPDGTRLVSASGDWTLRVWDTLQPREREKR
jgi:WD40 repeat protein/tRNA A-37 threonylcarbamoyl transferase component Bud32